MGIDKNGGRCKRRRLRKLCDLDEHPLKQVDDVIDMPRVKVERVDKHKPKKAKMHQDCESTLLNKIRSLNAADKQDLAKIVALAILSRRRGFVSDERISRGDVRNTEHTQCSPSVLYFELVRRSSDKATTLEKCKAEWVTNDQVGIGGWFCVGGVMAPSTVLPLSQEDKRMVWLDDPQNDNWIEGQCLCMQTRSAGFSKADKLDDNKVEKRAIKFRYSIRNTKTNEVVVLGSTCIKNWGGEFARRADDLYKWAVRPVKVVVPAKKWLFQ